VTALRTAIRGLCRLPRAKQLEGMDVAARKCIEIGGPMKKEKGAGKGAVRGSRTRKRLLAVLKKIRERLITRSKGKIFTGENKGEGEEKAETPVLWGGGSKGGDDD